MNKFYVKITFTFKCIKIQVHNIMSVSKSILHKQYKVLCGIRSDINEHLPTLYNYAKKCNSIVECGVRDVVSSYAFASALVETPSNSYVLIDPYESNKISSFLELCKGEGINASFCHMSDLTCPLVKTDLLFIDTWHVYGQLKRELAYWNSHVNKYIIMHDTTVDEIFGETIREKLNASQQSIDSGIPINEINKGLWPAIEEFLAEHLEWKIEERFTNNNGLTILVRV